LTLSQDIMPEVIITYKDPKILMLLKDLSKYLDFVVSTPQETTINGVTIIRGDKTIAKKSRTRKNKR
jgi:hypothetical protein